MSWTINTNVAYLSSVLSDNSSKKQGSQNNKEFVIVLCSLLRSLISKCVILLTIHVVAILNFWLGKHISMQTESVQMHLILLRKQELVKVSGQADIVCPRRIMERQNKIIVNKCPTLPWINWAALI